MNRQRLFKRVMPKGWTWTVLLSLIMVPWGIAAGQPAARTIAALDDLPAQPGRQGGAAVPP